jgi:hypothetical protein
MRGQKPNTEELEANAMKVAEELENNPPKETSEEKETSKEEEKEKVEEKEVKEPPQEEEKEKKNEKEVETVDYKKKFSESTREAQVLHAKNRKINEAMEKARELGQPTDEEMAKEYAEWDVMDEVSRKLAKKEYLNDRRFAMLDEVTKESKDIDAWNEKVDKFITDPRVLSDHPELEGKEEDFKAFSTKPTRRGVDFEDLVAAFLFDATKKQIKHKGAMLETSGGGEKSKPKEAGKISIDEARTLRQTDYTKYKEYLRAGKIENDF